MDEAQKEEAPADPGLLESGPEVLEAGPGAVEEKAVRMAGAPRWWLRIPVLIVIMIMAGLLGWLGMSILSVLGGKLLEVRPEDRGLMIDIHRVSEIVDEIQPNPEMETIVKKQYYDRSLEIEYEYYDPETPSAPYVNCTVNIESNEKDADLVYRSLWRFSKVGASIDLRHKSKIREEKDLFQWGDDSRFGIIVSGDRAHGNLFIARRGIATFYFLLSGYCIEKPEEISNLLQPALDQLEIFERGHKARSREGQSVGEEAATLGE